MEDVVMRQELLRAQEEVARLRALLDDVIHVVFAYGGWYEDAPEDSWRFERDLRTALGMDQYKVEDIW